MECKKRLIFFLKHIDKIDFKEKQIVLISGQDMSAGDAVFKHIQKDLKKKSIITNALPFRKIRMRPSTFKKNFKQHLYFRATVF